jgi:hypothetical protein
MIATTVFAKVSTIGAAPLGSPGGMTHGWLGYRALNVSAIAAAFNFVGASSNTKAIGLVMTRFLSWRTQGGGCR